MTEKEPATELDPRYSSENAQPSAWEDACKHLERAEIFWLSSVRPDGRPHVTPLLALWLDGTLYFSTGANERKAKNIANNAHCILTTGSSALNQEGLDLVVEGDAVRVIDSAKLQRVADAYEAKYGSAWRYVVHEGALYHEWEVSSRGEYVNAALVFEVAPTTAFGFGKGEIFSQTRWRF